nr:PAS domain-containing protein [Streptomyces sp. PSAA01]
MHGDRVTPFDEASPHLNDTGTPLTVTDAVGRVVAWSTQAARLVGLGAEDAVGRPVADVLGTHPQWLTCRSDEWRGTLEIRGSRWGLTGRDRRRDPRKGHDRTVLRRHDPARAAAAAERLQRAPVPLRVRRRPELFARRHGGRPARRAVGDRPPVPLAG